MKKKIISILLCVLLIVGLLPMSVFAAGEEDQYLIISNGYALSSKTTGSYTSSNNSVYDGFKGVAYTEGRTTVTDDMLWNVTNSGNSYTIMQDGKYLTGTYTSGTGGALTLSGTAATWTYSSNHLTMGSGNLTHSDGTPGVSGNPNVFSMRSSSNAGTITFVKYTGGTPDTPDTPAPMNGEDYLIISNGYALSSKTAGSYTTSGGSYSGYKGVKYTTGMTATDDMIWNVSIVGNSYTIMQDGKYLTGTYTSGTGGALTLSGTNAAWTFSSNHLTMGSGSLTHSDGTSGVNDNPNVFSMRSSGNAGTITFVKYTGGTPDTPDTPVTPATGEGYLIISNNYALSSATAGSYTTSGGSYSGYKGVRYTNGSTVTSDMLWDVTISGNSYTISQNGKYLTGTYTSGTGGALTLSNTSAAWTYSSNHLTMNGGNLTHSDGTSGVNDNPNVFSMRSSSNAGNISFVKYTGDTPVTPPTPTGDTTYVAFSSDVHNDDADNENSSANRLDKWLDNVSGKIGADFDEMGFCGDSGDAGGYNDAFWSDVATVMNIVAASDDVDGNGFFVAGNHEWQNGSFGTTTNATAQKIKKAGEKVVDNDYIIYSFGATSGNQGFNSDDITALSTYLASAPKDRPIFVLSHFPLHSYNNRTSANAASVISALNAAAASDRTVIFLWGHNHTERDTNYDKIITDKIENTAIDFTYAAAGCMAGNEYNSASGSIQGKGLVVGIGDDEFSMTYYDENGNVKGSSATIKFETAEGGGTTPDEPTPTGDAVEITPSTDNPSASKTIAVGETFTIKVKNGSSSSSYTFTASSDNGAATVSPASASIAAGGTAEFTVTGVKDGTAAISFVNNSSYGSQYARKGTVNVTVGTGVNPAEPPATGTVEVTPSTDNPSVNAVVGAGETIKIKVTNGSSRSSYTFNVTSDNTGVATVSPASASIAAGGTAEFTVTGVKNGTAVISVENSNTYGSQYARKATINLTVGESVTLSNTSVKLPIGQTKKITATVSGSTGTVTWSTSDASVATVANDGTITAIKAGTATITAKLSDTVKAECKVTVKDPSVQSGTTYLAFTSDVHNGSGNVSSAERLDKWVNILAEKNDAPFDRFGFCGDMGPASGSFWPNAQTVMDKVEGNENIENGGFYVCGNHEYNPGNYTHNLNDTTKKYSDAGEYVEEDNYILYSLGARQWDETYSDTDINALASFLNDHSDFGGPIFILAHFPLHCYNGYTSGESSGIHDGRAAVGTEKIINVLNKAADDNGQTIVFLWGHNHSSSNDHYDQVYTDKINNYDISFTYAAAGSMSDSEYGSSGNVKGKGLVAEIENDTLTLTYYDANGNVVGKGAEIELKGTTPSVQYTITATAAANGTISPSGSVAVKEGRSKTFTIAPNAGFEVDTVTVDGKTITVTGNTFTVENVTKNMTVSVTFKAAQGKNYEPVNNAQAGSTYIIVSNGYALANINGKISAIPVSANGNNIFLNDSDVKNASWTFEAATGTDKAGDFVVANNGYKFTRESDGNGTAMPANITTGTPVSDASGLPYYQWNYADGVLSQIGGQDGSATFTAYYDTANGAFYTASDATQSTKLYVVSNTPVDPTVEVTSVTISNVPASIEIGKTAKLTATVNPSNATDKTVTWTSVDTSVATVAADGTVTALKAGTATIIATAGSKSATASITVSAAVVEVTSVTINNAPASLEVGKTTKLTATVTPDNATNKTVTWTSADTSVATVAADGTVTALKAGTATIIATAGSKSVICSITVKEAQQPTDENPTIDNNYAVGSKTEFEDSDTLIVDCTQACIVLAKLANGKFERIEAEKRDDDTYAFDMSDIEGEFSLTIALKGDVNFDGKVDMSDATKVMLAWVNNTPLDDVETYAADIDNANGIMMNDATAIMLSWVNNTPLAWN